MRKGVSLPTVMAILAVILSSIFIGISAEMILKPGDYIRENSVFLVSERISSSVYAMNSMERAEMQLDLEAKYKFEKENADKLTYIRYGENRDAIDPGVQYSSQTGNATKICISKSKGSNPVIRLEGC